MLYRKMKKNGDELSILGFGCMRLPQKKARQFLPVDKPFTAVNIMGIIIDLI